MTDRARMKARYRELRDKGLCVQCSAPSAKVRCPRCYRPPKSQATGRRAEKAERWAADRAKVLETAATRNPKQQAEDLGCNVDRVYAIRAQLRRQGHELPNLGTPTKHFLESAKWDPLDDPTVKGCGRCGLRGPHECLPAHADGWERRGPGRSYPEPGGCGISTKERNKMREKIPVSKFVRFTNAKRDAVRAGR